MDKDYLYGIAQKRLEAELATVHPEKSKEEELWDEVKRIRQSDS